MHIQELREIHLGDLNIPVPKAKTKEHKNRRQVIVPKITQAETPKYKEEVAHEVTRDLLSLLVKKLLGNSCKDVDSILGNSPKTPTKYTFDTITLDSDEDITKMESALRRMTSKGSDEQLKPQSQVNSILTELYGVPVTIVSNPNAIVIYALTFSRPKLNRSTEILLVFGLERGVVI